MKFKIDECVDARVAAQLRRLGYNADTVVDENLTGATDVAVYRAATLESRMVITLDGDFADLWREHDAATPAFGIFWARLKPENQHNIAAYVALWFADPVVVQSWFGCLVIGTEVRLRVRQYP